MGRVRVVGDTCLYFPHRITTAPINTERKTMGFLLLLLLLLNLTPGPSRQTPPQVWFWLTLLLSPSKQKQRPSPHSVCFPLRISLDIGLIGIEHRSTRGKMMTPVYRSSSSFTLLPLFADRPSPPFIYQHEHSIPTSFFHDK